MLGENIRNIRKENKMSQEELAEKLGVSRQSISLWENNQNMPSMDNIIAISKIFNTSTDVLLNEKVILKETPTSEKSKKVLSKKNIIIFSILIVLVATLTISVILVSKPSKIDLSAEEIFSLITPSTVEINGTGDTFTSTGTGIFIDKEGTVVTNYHVIESCYTINIVAHDGSIYEAKNILGFDKNRDIAIIQTNCKNSVPVELKTEQVHTGEKVYTLGSSLGLTGTFSEGLISSESREIEELEYIQITAPISNGNSGGPLVDKYGKVIGITTGAFTEGQNLNLAIPAKGIYEVSREKQYSVNEFYLLSQGDVVEQELPTSTPTSNESENEEEEYLPIDIGYFETIDELEVEAQRNPALFDYPVKVTVGARIIRTDNDSIYSIQDMGYFEYLRIAEEQELLSENQILARFKKIYKVFMADDSKNRVITGDIVVLTGVYRHKAKTFSECTYELVENVAMSF